MEQRPTTWYLTIRKGPNTGSAYPLPDGGTVSIGRHANNQIVIDDPMVSRHHARLVWRGNGYSLEDMGSANGTWVNNVLITSPVALRAGDLIGLSQEVLLAFSDQPQADETMHAPSAHGAPAPVAVRSPSGPVSPPAAAAPPRTHATQSWMAFGLGGIIAVLAVLTIIAVGLAVYLLLLKPSETEDVGVQAAASTPTPIPTATPYPTYTPSLRTKRRRLSTQPIHLFPPRRRRLRLFRLTHPIQPRRQRQLPILRTRPIPLPRTGRSRLKDQPTHPSPPQLHFHLTVSSWGGTSPMSLGAGLHTPEDAKDPTTTRARSGASLWKLSSPTIRSASSQTIGPRPLSRPVVAPCPLASGIITILPFNRTRPST